jgi:hypothetical protein
MQTDFRVLGSIQFETNVPRTVQAVLGQIFDQAAQSWWMTSMPIGVFAPSP